MTDDLREAWEDYLEASSLDAEQYRTYDDIPVEPPPAFCPDDPEEAERWLNSVLVDALSIARLHNRIHRLAHELNEALEALERQRPRQSRPEWLDWEWPEWAYVWHKPPFDITTSPWREWLPAESTEERTARAAERVRRRAS